MSLSSRMFGSRGGLQTSYGRGWESGPFLSPTYVDEFRDPVGLTAVAAAVRFISETIASFVMRVYEGDAENRQPVLNAPQAGLLQNGAPGYCTAFDMWSDVLASVELWGEGLIWKGRRFDGRVSELYAFPTETACIYVDESGNKVIEARIDGNLTDITANVIHVRGWSPIASVSAERTSARHRRTLSGALAIEEFRGRFFDNDATPNLLLTHPGSPTTEQRADLRSSWQATHGGPNGSKTGFLWGGITAQQLSSTLEQSQVEQLMNLDVQQVARMFAFYPQKLLLADPSARLDEAEAMSDSLLRFTLLSRMRRVERAISCDREIFPQPRRYCSFDAANFVRGSVAVAAAKAHQLVQVGVITANEARAELGYSRSDDPKADQLLETPVGAGANQAGQLALFGEPPTDTNGNGAHAARVPADSTA